jgi:hypothetical protein
MKSACGGDQNSRLLTRNRTCTCWGMMHMHRGADWLCRVGKSDREPHLGHSRAGGLDLGVQAAVATRGDGALFVHIHEAVSRQHASRTNSSKARGSQLMVAQSAHIVDSGYYEWQNLIKDSRRAGCSTSACRSAGGRTQSRRLCRPRTPVGGDRAVSMNHLSHSQQFARQAWNRAEQMQMSRSRGLPA